MKNISMTTKQIKVQEEPVVYHQPVYVAPKPAPAKSPIFQKPADLTNERFEKQSFEKYETSFQKTSESVPMRPKFQPIEKPSYQQQTMKSSVSEKNQFVYKPTPLTPAQKSVPKMEEQSQFSESKESYYHYSPSTPTYYTAVAAQPIHKGVAAESSSTMHMKESTEKSHRVVNISTTKRVIAFDDSKKLEPFPFTPNQEQFRRATPKVPPPPTPTKFIPGEFRESDYDSEIESARIRPVWTPNPSDSENLHYRRVRPPSQQSRSSSLPRSYERVMTPMEFDTKPVLMPTKINVQSPSLKTPLQYFSSPLYRDQCTKTQTVDRNVSKKTQSFYKTTDDISIRNNYVSGASVVDNATSQMKTINKSLHSKAHQFLDDVMKDVNQPKKPAYNKTVSLTEPHAYRNETRVSQYGEYF